MIGDHRTSQKKEGIPVLINGFSQVAHPERVALTVYGTEGTLALHNWIELWSGGAGEELKRIELPSEKGIAPNYHLQELLTQFVRAIDGEPADLCTFETGYQVQVILDTLQSANGKGWVHLQ